MIQTSYFASLILGQAEMDGNFARNVAASKFHNGSKARSNVKGCSAPLKRVRRISTLQNKGDCKQHHPFPFLRNVFQ